MIRCILGKQLSSGSRQAPITIAPDQTVSLTLRSSLRHALTTSAAFCPAAAIAAAITAAGLESAPRPLEVRNAPAPSPLPDEWKHATLFHADDFEHVPDGSFPPGWRYHPAQRGPLSDFSAIRRTLDGGGVLHLRGDGWVPLREKPTGGHLMDRTRFPPNRKRLARPGCPPH